MLNRNAAESEGKLAKPPTGETLQLVGASRLGTFTGDSFAFLNAPEAPTSAATMPNVPGFEMLRVLGRGGMGVVYLARQVQLDRLVALKMILGGLDARPEDRERFRAEAQAIARLQHPNIVQLHDLGECEGRPYFSLEYVAGGNLADFMAGQPRPPREAAELIETLARAVHYAHEQGIVHRDLKPANILLAVPGSLSAAVPKEGANAARPAASHQLSAAAAKIADFGLARLMHRDSRLTQTGDVIGTPSYMAPEQAHGRAGDLGPSVDIYSLGAMLYELLTGRPPFQGVSPMETILLLTTCEPASPSVFQPRLPPDLVTICLKCLQKEPARRYASAADLADDLRRFLSHQPIQARPISGLEKTIRWSRRNPALAASLAMLALVVLAGMAAITSLWLYAERERGDAEASARKTEAALRLAQQREEEAQAANDAAERNLRRALNTIDQTLLKLAEMQQSQQPEFEPERTALLEGALAILTETLKENPSSTAARRQAMEVSRRVAEINRQLGRLPETEAAYARGLVLARQLVLEQPDSLEAHSALFRMLSGVAAFNAKQLRLEESIRMQTEALREAETILRLAGGSGPHARDVGYARQTLGQYHQGVGRMRDALPHLQRGVEEMEASAAKTPDAANGDLPRAKASLARCLGELGKKREGEEMFRAALELAERHLAERPDDLTAKYQAAALAGDFGTYLSFMPRPKDALPRFQRAEQLFREMAAARPLRPDLKSGVARSLMNAAVIHYGLGDKNAALNCCTEAIAINEALCKGYPHVVEYATNRVRGMQLFAAAQASMGNLPVARQTMEQALVVAEEQAARFAVSPEMAMMPAVIKTTLAEIALTNGQPQEATRLTEEIKAHVRALRQRFPEDATIRAQCEQIDHALLKLEEFKKANSKKAKPDG